jgi:hypothetical protein
MEVERLSISGLIDQVSKLRVRKRGLPPLFVLSVMAHLEF